MRILHSVLSLDMGGAHVSAVKLACGMRRKGHDVFLSYAPMGGRENKTHPSLMKSIMDHDVKIVPLKYLRRRPSLLLDPLALYETAAITRRIKPDVVNTHSVKPGLFSSMIPRFINDTPVVHTLRGFAAEKTTSGLRRRLFLRLENFILRNADSLVTLSPMMAQKIRDRGIRVDSRLRIIRSGFDIEHYRKFHDRKTKFRVEMGIPEEIPVVGAVAALVMEKGILDMAEVFLEIGRRNEHVHFVLVGDGPLRNDLLNLIAPLEDRFHFFGLQADTAPFYALMDCLVISSISEGLPRVAVEAFCTGLPVVSTDVGAISELVIQGITGFLVPKGDTTQLASKALYLLENKEVRSEFGTRARVKIDDEFRIENVIDLYLELYSEMI
ncbi:MAG: glycosyltransferase [Candidatus Aegiribacteria sp.]|nr:glycosyltransferase [Candidatus Aegiribacteria sp.]